MDENSILQTINKLLYLNGSQGNGSQGNGSQGIQGPKGDQGIQGIQGPKGDQGIQGMKGDQGIQGMKGDQGIQGMKGDNGNVIVDANNNVFTISALNATPGSNNTAIGVEAGQTSLGSNNIYLGYQAKPTLPSINNEIVLGNSAITALRCQQTSIAGLSDIRDKTEVLELDGEESLFFINQIQPVHFRWDKREWYESGISDGSKIGLSDMGFIAQDLLSHSHKDYYQIVKTENPERYEVAPARLIPILVSAIQELSKKLNFI